ncbi:MAG: helix-hairpin-helix domain-containing protein [Cyanobacteria bacterium P01_H01_bin.15]
MPLARWLFGNSLTPAQRALRQKLESDHLYRFASLQELKLGIVLGFRLDVNKASIDEWLRLPGISIRQARSLVQLTGMGVQFLSVEDLAAALGVSLGQVKLLAEALEFCYYDETSIEKPLRLNPNQASLEQLVEIPVLAPALAERIVAERNQASFENLATLAERLSLNGEVTTQLLHYLQF